MGTPIQNAEETAQSTVHSTKYTSLQRKTLHVYIHKIKKHGLLPDEDRRAIKNLSAALSRVREAKIEVQTAQDQLEMFLDHSNNGDTNGTMDDGGIKCHQIVGLISIKDMLMENTKQQDLPALEWLNEQRMEDIANRGGYSE